MTKTIYNEWYGEVTRAQLAAYRRYGVSPHDHNCLADEFGEDNHAAITAAVKERSQDGYYQMPWPSFP